MKTVCYHSVSCPGSMYITKMNYLILYVNVFKKMNLFAVITQDKYVTYYY